MPHKPMKALSIWQPYASLTAIALKRHITMSWSTTYRGPIAIHAAKTIDRAGAPEDLCASAFGRNWSRLLPIGMLMAVGELVACIPADNVRAKLHGADLAAGNFSKGLHAWRIDNVRRLARPIPMIGRQGLFNLTPPAGLSPLLEPVADHAAACRYIGWA